MSAQPVEPPVVDTEAEIIPMPPGLSAEQRAELHAAWQRSMERIVGTSAQPIPVHVSVDNLARLRRKSPAVELWVVVPADTRAEDPETKPAPGSGAAVLDVLRRTVGTVDDAYGDDVLNVRSVVDDTPRETW